MFKRDDPPQPPERGLSRGAEVIRRHRLRPLRYHPEAGARRGQGHQRGHQLKQRVEQPLQILH